MGSLATPDGVRRRLSSVLSGSHLRAVSSREPQRERPLYRLVVIVRRGETSIFAHLANELSDAFQRAGTRPSLEVIWDRRQAERRRWARRVAVDRRRGERRQPVPETWTTWGFVVATVRR